jgi:hypothetical protein
MVSIAIKRTILNTLADFTSSLVLGVPKEISGSFYIPFSLDSFSAPNISITGCTLTSTQTRINGTASAFDNVRVGDIVTSTSTGTLTAKTALTVDNCYTAQGLPFVTYPHTVDLATVGVKAGDAVSGGGIAANTKVDKIDYDSRRIYLTENCSATGIQTSGNILTFTPPIRVTAVRPSTATANANQIDIDTSVATSGAASTVVITPGAGEAVAYVLKVTPVDNTTGSQLSSTVEFALVPGTAVVGSTTGYNNLTFTTLTYLSLPAIKFDLDSYLTAARFPRPASV